MNPRSPEFLSVLRTQLRGLRSDGRGKILLAIAGGWFLSMGVRMIYPVLLPYLREAYDLGLTASGLLLTVLFLAYALGQLPGGMLADRFGERLILAGSMVASAVTIALVITAGSTVVLFVATAMFGFGTALYAVARYTILPGLYPEQLGAANGLTAASQDGGQSVLPPIAGAIAAAGLWQLGFGFVIPLFLLVGVVLWWVTPATKDEPDEDDDGFSLQGVRELLAVLRQRSIVFPAGVFLFGLSIWQAFTSFYPTYLIEVKGLSTTVASVLFGLFFALGILIKPLSGGAFDRVGVRRSLVVIATGPILAFVALPFVDSLAGLVVVTILASTVLGQATVTEPFLLRTLPDEVRGTGFGVLRTVSFLIASLSPVAFGAAADFDFFDEAFLFLAVLGGGMILLTVSIPED